MTHCKIKEGWEDAGKTGVIVIDEPVKDLVNGTSWTAVLWDGEEDPTFFKSRGLVEYDLFTEIAESGLNEHSDYGYLITVSKFLEYVEGGAFVDYDGNGHLATARKESEISISPSTCQKTLALHPWATHVMWFNR